MPCVRNLWLVSPRSNVCHAQQPHRQTRTRLLTAGGTTSPTTRPRLRAMGFRLRGCLCVLVHHILAIMPVSGLVLRRTLNAASARGNGCGRGLASLAPAGTKVFFRAGPDAGASGDGSAARGEASEMMRAVRTKGTQAARKAGQPVARRQIDFQVMPPAGRQHSSSSTTRSTIWDRLCVRLMMQDSKVYCAEFL
jgi:hypothetical protein